MTCRGETAMKRQLDSKYRELVKYINERKNNFEIMKLCEDIFEETNIWDQNTPYYPHTKEYKMIFPIYNDDFDWPERNKLVPIIVDIYNDNYELEEPKYYWKFKELRLILEEIFGYVLFRRNELGKAFILTGDGSNGKSSYLKIVRKLVGSDNTSSLDLKELGQRFKTAELFGKLANIGDDISNEYIKDNSEFKKLTTGETINAERKGRDPFDFNNYSKLIFSANKMPRINDTSNGLTRRLMFIPFNAHFTSKDSDYDPFITDKLLSTESMQYVLLLGLNGLKRLLKNHKFATSKRITAEAAKYEELNNPIILYLRDEQPKLVNEVVKDTYVMYSLWCTDNGYKAVSQIAFSREVCRMKKLSTKTQRFDGKRKQIFVSIP